MSFIKQNIDINSNPFKTWRSHLKLLGITKHDDLKFDQVPIFLPYFDIRDTNLHKTPHVKIGFTGNKNIYTDYFSSQTDRNYNLLLNYFIRIMNEHSGRLKYYPYGGVIRSIISGQKINDIDIFCCIEKNASYFDSSILDFIKTELSKDENVLKIELDHEYLQRLIKHIEHKFYNRYLTDSLETHHLHDICNKQIDMIVYLLHMTIYGTEIKTKSIYKIVSSPNQIIGYTFIYETEDGHELKIDINKYDSRFELEKIKFDFKENMLYFSYMKGVVSLQNAKQYKNNKTLIYYILSQFTTIVDVNILEIIINMIGETYITCIETMYYICKKKLRMKHDNCLSLTSSFQDSSTPSDQDLHFNKLIFIRCAKFIKNGWTIECSKCSHNSNCICSYIYKLFRMSIDTGLKLTFNKTLSQTSKNRFFKISDLGIYVNKNSEEHITLNEDNFNAHIRLLCHRSVYGLYQKFSYEHSLLINLSDLQIKYHNSKFNMEIKTNGNSNFEISSKKKKEQKIKYHKIQKKFKRFKKTYKFFEYN